MVIFCIVNFYSSSNKIEYIMAAKGSKGLLFLRTEVLCTVILDKVFKNEPSKICERQPLPANYLKAVIFIG